MSITSQSSWKIQIAKFKLQWSSNNFMLKNELLNKQRGWTHPHPPPHHHHCWRWSQVSWTCEISEESRSCRHRGWKLRTSFDLKKDKSVLFDTKQIKRKGCFNEWRTSKSKLRVLTSLWLRTSSGGQRCTHDTLLFRPSFLLVLFIHLRTFYVLQAPSVNRSQPLFKLFDLSLINKWIITKCKEWKNDL